MPNLRSYPAQRVEHLPNWKPNPQPYYHYEKHNDEYGVKPTASLSLRKSDMAIASSVNGYMCWWATMGYPSPSHFSYPYSEQLVQCNEDIRNASEVVSFDEDAIVIPFSSIYSNWNQGHEVSVAAYTYIAYSKTKEAFPDRDVYVAISSQSLNSTNTSQLLKSLFPEDFILELETGRVYEFNSFVTTPANDFYLNSSTKRGGKGGSDEPLVNQALDLILEYAKVNATIELESSKFILAKTSEHKSFRKSGIVPDYVLEELKFNGWCVLNPENLSFLDVISILSGATQVIFGSGGVQYAHKYFVSRYAKIYTLFETRNYPAYDGQDETNLGLHEDKSTRDNWKDTLRVLGIEL